VTMRYEDRETVADFERRITEIPHVLQAQRLFGDPDYLLRVVARDLHAYQRLYESSRRLSRASNASAPPS
jgi:DNA-binding Lrp family transcriptional regulator